MNLSAQGLLTGVCAAVAAGAVAYYIRRVGDWPVTELEYEDGFLTTHSLEVVLADMKAKCRARLVRTTQLTLRKECSEARRPLRTRPQEYEAVVVSYLAKEREVMCSALQEVLGIYGIPKGVFEESVRRNLQVEGDASALSLYLRFEAEDGGAKVPQSLTKDVYCQVMQEFGALISRAKSEAAVPLAPFALIVLLSRAQDELQERFGYSEAELATAGARYSCARTAVICEKVRLAVAELTNPRQVASY